LLYVVCHCPTTQRWPYLRSMLDSAADHPMLRRPRRKLSVKGVLRTLFAPVSWCAYRLSLLGTRRTEYKRLQIMADINEPDLSISWIAAVVEALALIDRTAAFRFARIKRDVRRVIISGVVGPEYVASLKAIRLHGPAVSRQDTLRIAQTIVHEGAHARIARRGIAYSPDQRARHERVATRAEAGFVLRLTGDRDKSNAVLQKLERPWWTQEEVTKRHLGDWDRLGLTGPIAKLLRHLIARRGRS
jgi:hypothetical protein